MYYRFIQNLVWSFKNQLIPGVLELGAFLALPETESRPLSGNLPGCTFSKKRSFGFWPLPSLSGRPRSHFRKCTFFEARKSVSGNMIRPLGDAMFVLFVIFWENRINSDRIIQFAMQCSTYQPKHCSKRNFRNRHFFR